MVSLFVTLSFIRDGEKAKVVLPVTTKMLGECSTSSVDHPAHADT